MLDQYNDFEVMSRLAPAHTRDQCYISQMVIVFAPKKITFPYYVVFEYLCEVTLTVTTFNQIPLPRTFIVFFATNYFFFCQITF